MKLILSAHKTTKHNLISHHQYLLHDLSALGSRIFQASCSEGGLNSQRYQANSLKHSILTSVCGMQSSNRLMNVNKHANRMKKVEIEIISRETIKPTYPTPYHLRTYKLSLLDQTMYDVYTPWALFLPNSNEASIKDVVSKRAKHLKENLSRILTQFYPLAGELIKNSLYIDCNDKGVYYMEARVNETLENFLRDPDDEKVRELIPKIAHTMNSTIRNYVLGIQVNIFSCGGIVLTTSSSHKIVDFHTYMMFMKAWAAAVRGSPETISPSLMASEVFPNDPSLEDPVPANLMNIKLLSTKRFVFDSKSLAILKAQPVAYTPTRMEATTAVIWKAAAKAASTCRSPYSLQSPHLMFSVVNIRKRASPPLPDNSIGNVVSGGYAICFPGNKPNLPTLMSKLRESIANVNSGHIDCLKGVKGHKTMKDRLNMIKLVNAGDCMLTSSMLNSGIYDLDFGWGKPIWFYVMNPGIVRFVALTDTNGGGVEAIVTLSLDEMEKFECDPELLSHATVNPSPLLYLNH
uniref:stemmadenine O-acetyltransferase-like n=1 Tax=Erigeron canadensis TaxID=72917 RepID=UPI001CB8CC34|nr:stemmadenine O-acetyltransferase-like [Erigeron canadensis]